MRKWIVLLYLLCVSPCWADGLVIGWPAAGGGPPIAFVNAAQGNLPGSAGATSCATSALSVTAGNTIIVGVSEYHANTTITDVTDSSGNDYIKCGNTEKGDTAHDAEIWIATNVNAGASTVITATFSDNTEYVNVLAAQYSGILSSSPCDASAAGVVGSSGTSHISGTTATTSVANEVVIGLWMDWSDGGTLSNGTATNMRITASGAALTDKIVSSTGTQTNALISQKSTQMFSMIRTFKGVTQ
jgi:hypothetical protein